MGTTHHRHRHSLLAQPNSKRIAVNATSPTTSRAPVRFRALGRIGAQLNDSWIRSISRGVTQSMPRHGLARSVLSLCILVAAYGCERSVGATPAEFLGGVPTKMPTAQAHSNTKLTKSADKFNSRDDLAKAINELAQTKQLLAVERLSADAVRQYPQDSEFKIIHARALLDLGRTKTAKTILEQFMQSIAHKDEARFLTAIALLSDLQRGGDTKALARKTFVQATTLLYEVVQSSPNFKDRFPPNTHINQVRQGLVKYSKPIDLDSLSLRELESETAVLAMLDILKRLDKHSLVSTLLKSAHVQYPKSNSLWLSRAELHLTQNEPLVALEFINQVKSLDTLTSEELLTYAAGQIAAAKQLNTPGIQPFARSYQALIIAESHPEDSVFKTLIPRVKKTIYGLLPTDVKTRSTSGLSAGERQAFLQMLKDAGLNSKSKP